MTRGTFYLITDQYFYGSIEFNGDMYPEGYGDMAFEMLKQVKSPAEFKAMVQQFNKEAHNYDENEVKIYERPLSFLQGQKDMSKNYYDFWFSDWLFIKNISSSPITFTLVTKSKYELKPGAAVRLTFGRLPE